MYGSNFSNNYRDGLYASPYTIGGLVADVVRNLPKALSLPGGVWNFGSENGESTYDTVKSVLECLGLDAVNRLQPNTEAFADCPRDISMDLAKLRSAGITFPATPDALLDALRSATR